MPRKKAGLSLYVFCAVLFTTGGASLYAADKIYKTTDEYGVPLYSNIPPGPGAEEVDVPQLSIIPPPGSDEPMRDPMQPPLELAQDTTRENERPRSGNIYKLSIVRPEQDEVVQVAGTPLQVQLNLEPPLDVAAGHRIEIVVDGEVSAETSQTRVSLPGLDRGEHRLSVRVVNDRDEVVQSTNAVAFFAQQPVIFPGNADR